MGTMKGMLRRENVQIVESCGDWENAVRVAVQPLVDTGYVTPAYADGIIETACTFGPYFVLAPGLALLHARPEQGVIRQQLAVTVSRRGVSFKKGGDPVHVLVTLAAENPDDHIDTMGALARLFADQASIERVATAASADEVYALFVGSHVD